MLSYSEILANFLQVNNTKLLVTVVNGINYVAIKPICEALDLEFAGQLVKLKNDRFFASALCVCIVKVPSLQGIEYTCISDKFVFDWICSINPEDKKLVQCKRQIYDLLYNHCFPLASVNKTLNIN